MKRGMCLLLVDDEPMNLVALRACLEPLGHEVLTARSGHLAIRAFEEFAPDLIMLDLVMPGFDGIDVLKRIRSHPSRGDTPVILLTAHSEREHRLRGMEAGADDFLEKPIDAALLIARTKTLLRLKEGRDELQASRDALAERNTSLERSQREQQELTEFIVHDLKGPLTGIVANTEWVYGQLTHEDNALALALEDVLTSSGRLRLMINDLTALSQLERGTFPIERHRIPIGPMLRSVTKEFQRAAAQKNIALVDGPDLSVSIDADPGLLQRVLENILDNSLRYTPLSGRVSVRAEVRDQVEIEVSNSGPSIPVVDRERIFEKFARGSGTGPRAGNAGIGLYFCKRAVEAHGGRIDVIETDEFPTCFRIRLPAA